MARPAWLEGLDVRVLAARDLREVEDILRGGGGHVEPPALGGLAWLRLEPGGEGYAAELAVEEPRGGLGSEEAWGAAVALERVKVFLGEAARRYGEPAVEGHGGWLVYAWRRLSLEEALGVAGLWRGRVLCMQPPYSDPEGLRPIRDSEAGLVNKLATDLAALFIEARPGVAAVLCEWSDMLARPDVKGLAEAFRGDEYMPGSREAYYSAIRGWMESLGAARKRKGRYYISLRTGVVYAALAGVLEMLIGFEDAEGWDAGVSGLCALHAALQGIPHARMTWSHEALAACRGVSREAAKLEERTGLLGEYDELWGPRLAEGGAALCSEPLFPVGAPRGRVEDLASPDAINDADDLKDFVNSIISACAVYDELCRSTPRVCR